MPNKLFPTADDVMRQRLDADPTIALFNQFDWSSTRLGAVAMWPETLRAAVRMMMLSEVPMVMLVSEADGILVYNRGYAQFAGERHPAIFGQPVLTAWPEVSEFNAANMRRGFAGETWHFKDQELVLDRGAGPASAWLDLSYSPVAGEDGRPLAILAIVQETTSGVLARRALAQSEEKRALALSGGTIVGTWDWDIRNDRVVADERFAKLYSIDPAAAARGVEISSFVDGIHPADRARVGREIQHAVDMREEFRSEYRLRSEDGFPHWVLASGRAQYDVDGKPTRFPGVAIDITAEKFAAAELAESELRFRTLADTMPQMVWSTLPDGYHDYYNARWYEFTGTPEGSTDGEGWNGMFHPDDQERAWQVWRHSLVTGEPYRIEYRLRHHSGAYRWVLGQALPVRDAAGRITRWIGTCTDIHDSRLAQEEREIIAQELSHRIKNIFAVIGGIVSLAARQHPETADFAAQLRGRIFALSRAHDIVRPHGSGATSQASPPTMHGLIRQLVEPYRDGTESRLAFTGPDTPIDDGAATPLALLFHELATNAVKYGALWRPSGRISIETLIRGEEYLLVWRELGGPPPEDRPQSQGFGSRLISLSVEGQLRGKLERRWENTGLVVELHLPLASLRRRAALG